MDSMPHPSMGRLMATAVEDFTTHGCSPWCGKTCSAAKNAGLLAMVSREKNINMMVRRTPWIAVSSVIRCSMYKLTIYAAFAGTHHRYNPTARPFTPTNGSSIPSERPLPKNAMTGPSPPWAFSPSGVLGGREDDSQDRVDQS